ncbi:UDP-N-acetylmuramate--L-alanine ligase [Bacteroidia bacterium]|nr:UDP-N-acetylmuramate--L-alanine ligase [Bacteroidia bacterium]
MINLSNIQSLYLLGIGGIGMSALARYFHALGVKVSGYDKTETELTREMQNEGIDIHYEADLEKSQNVDLAIFTPAIPTDFEEFAALKACHIPMWKRAEILGFLTEGQHNICIAGTHGKTTITAMIAHILNLSDKKCNAFIGGIAKNYNSNLVMNGKNDIFVCEADEFDRSFLKLYPDIAVITSVEADHLDIYGNADALKTSFAEFAALLNKSKYEGILVKKYGVDINYSKTVTYSLDNPSSDYYSQNLTVENNAYHFDIVSPKGVLENIVMAYPGLHNVENAVSAYAVSKIYGVDEEIYKTAIASFQGVKRRFDIQINRPDLLFVDDYAHHPTEIRTTTESLKHFTGNKKIMAIFQPHLYTRTRDFADEFAKSLSLLDYLLLLDIYPAREKPIEGITSQMLLEKCTNSYKKLIAADNPSCEDRKQKSPNNAHSEILNEIIEEIRKINPEVLLTIGAGDIDQFVEAIRKKI